MAELTPEQQSRQNIDVLLTSAGWHVQDYKAYDPSVSSGVELREVPLKSGRCDYLLMVNRQPLGRGTRVLTPTDLQSVSGAEAGAKTHFVIVDAVGVCESDKTESRPLERKPTVAFDKLLLGVALGKRDEDSLTSLAGRLARLACQLTPALQKEIATTSGGLTLSHLSAGLLSAVDPDKVEAASRRLLTTQEAQWHLERASFFNPESGYSVTQANLPHWRQEGATYFVTFRLVDSLPKSRLDQWRLDRETWLNAHPEPWSEAEETEYHTRFYTVIEDWLDQGSGSCVLALPETASLVTDALRHFDGQRYHLGEFVIASNHVHVIVTPLPGNKLSDILHSWKSFSAKQICKLDAAAVRLEEWWQTLHQRRLNQALKESPSRYAGVVFQRPVWQKESFDHLVRSPASLCKFIEYIRNHREWENKRQDAASTLIEAARAQLVAEACAPFDKPALRDLLTKAKQDSEQTIATSVIDEVISQGFSAAARDKAAALAASFRDYIDPHQSEITALQILYSRPYAQRLTEPMLKELEKKLREQHAAWTEDNLWNAFAATAPDKVKGRTQAGRFADLVSLVRFALEQQPVLAPVSDSVHQRFAGWLAAKGEKAFTAEQLPWLHSIRDHIATSLSIELEDLDYTPFNQEGGLGKAHQLFGDQLPKLLEELNGALAA